MRDGGAGAGAVVSFLLARISDEETAAREAQPGPWHIGNAVDPTRLCNIHTIRISRELIFLMGRL
jgi:hypothetical protein